MALNRKALQHLIVKTSLSIVNVSTSCFCFLRVCVCVCPFFSTVSHSLWISKLRDSIVKQTDRETAEGGDRGSSRGRHSLVTPMSFQELLNSMFLEKKCLKTQFCASTGRVHSNGVLIAHRVCVNREAHS